MSAALRVFKWFALALLVLLACLALALLLVVQTGPGSRWAAGIALDQANSRLPGTAIRYDAMSGTLFDGLRLEGVEVDLAPEDGARTRVALEGLEFQWNPLALLDRGVDVQSLLLNGLDVSVTTVADAGGEPADVRAILEQLFSLPLSFEVDRFRLEGFDLAVNDRTFSAQRLESRLALDGRRALLEDLRLESERYDLAGDLRLGAGGDYPLTGELAWGMAGGELNLEGVAELAGDLETLRLDHRLLSPVAAASSGTLSPGLLGGESPRFDLTHQMDDAAAAVPGADILQSLSGTLRTTGTPALVDLGGDLNVTLENFEPFSVALDAAWDGAYLRVDSVSVENPLLDFAASGTLGFAPVLMLEAQWSLNRLDPSEYLPQVSLNEVEGSGGFSREGAGGQGDLSARVELASLNARLNGYPLSGSGRLALAGGDVESFNLDLRVQDNLLRLTGSLAPRLDVAWEVEAPSLQVILPELSGEVAGAGSLGGSLESPQVSGSLQGEAVRYESGERLFALAGFGLDAAYREQSGNNSLVLTLSSLSLPVGETPFEIESAALQLRGEPGQHNLSMEVSSAAGQLRLAAAGAYRDGGWDGSLGQALIFSDYGDWELAEPVMLSASASRLIFSSHCWNFLDASLCAEGEWSGQDGYSASLALRELPLALLNSPQTLARVEQVELARQLEDKPAGLSRLQERYSVQLPPNAFIDGILGLEADIASVPGESIPAIDARVTPRNLRLGLLVEQASDSQSVQPELQVFEFNDIDLALRRENSLWRSAASFAVSRREASGASLLGTLESRLSLDDAEQLDGEVSVDFADIAWVEILVPQVTNTRGELSARAEIGGKLSRLLLQAQLNLDEGAFQVPEYGLDINAVSIDLRSGEDNEITLNGSARSGEGGVTFASNISRPLQDSRKLSLQLQGENFQVMNMPDTQVVVNPDLALNLDSERLDVRGGITVPRFLLDLEQSQVVAGTGAVGVSRDVVVVEAPPEQRELVEGGAGAEMVRRIAVTGDVTLSLGEQVRFSGYGLDLLLDGDLEIEMEPNRPILVYGEVTVEEGTYESYGQELNAEGKLIFLGNPANPALDLRAYRQVNNATVGVQMSGTLSNIQGQLYSTPALPESEILAMLVTGRSFQNVGPQDESSLLTAIANFGIERGQGITNTVRSKLGLDTLDLSGGETLDESSLGLGKYITPDLFLRYDIGLFDRESTLSLNYTLTERLRLEVESGVSQSVDLTYTVEK